ncbi:MAG TPA: hypothetical protein VMF30_05015, partial [Pirellulales bacterium]|nr:hypothetical protein [Pirellulales bacterium]
DFRAATSKDGSLVDAFIRQGRIVAKYEPVDAHVLWKSCFYSAYRLLSGEAKRGTPSDGRESATAGDEKAPPPAPEPVEPVPALDSLDPPKLESLPPQLAYEVGRAYYYMQKAKADRYSDEEARVTIAQENRPYDERNPPTPGKPLTGVAGRAEAFVKFAGKKCPTWYRPPAALGDIYAAKALLRPGNDRPDLKTVQIRYLSRAASQFRNSLRFNARYDDALRGQAEALQYLAVDPNPPEITGVTDDQIEYFLSAGYGANPAAQSRMLDEAYRSAEAANIVTGGRDAKTLRIIGRIENFRTFMVNAGKSYEYAARAAQIFREAGEISLSTSDRNELDDSVLYSKRTAYWVLANLAAQVESEFREASAEAETIRPTVDTLFAKMGSIRPFPDQDLGEAIRSAHHAFVGIENIQPLGKELTVPATKRLTAPRVGSVAAQAAARPTVYDINAWPNELPTVRDLMDRVAEIGSWRLIFRQLEIRAAVFARQYVIPPELPKDDPKRILLIEFIADLGELPKP